ncbi:cell division protein FtsX [Niabella ginsenosidivorans]|uniref:Cell division protein FtsX n=1 Tax=Niabella ginsenosidivorans TaxID=1176587 RepID=A0A1A9I1C6_9BACT|nr:ABC transporter permease [Niabella ginsenosidivorans]ANH81467.1 cell division protein FtsX [Niabella ginsenosidivorans]
MISNYIKTAWRNIVKNKTYSVINVIGLAIGLACFLLIALYVADETGYDRFYPNADRIYRINTDFRFGDEYRKMAQTSDMMGPLLKKDYPQVEEYTRIYTSDGPGLIKKGNQYINEKSVASVDSTFFNIFPLPVIAGGTRHALDEPNTVVVTAAAANRYFGSTNVLGKILQVKKQGSLVPFKITAVIKDIPANSHFHFDLFFSMKNVDYNWGAVTSHNFYTYLLLKEGTDYRVFEKNFTDYTRKYAIPYARKFMNINSLEEFEKTGNKLAYSLIPLTGIHLKSNRENEIMPAGNIQYVYIFSAVALFILFIACINFMNLTTARSANRAREVGIRKVLGTERIRLVMQFLFETVLMVFLALILAVIIDYAVLGVFNDLSAKQLRLSALLSSPFAGALLLLPVIVGLLAGSYPAFFLSGFKPIEVLKGTLKPGTKSGSLRSVLVVFQFATSILLIIATVVVYRQLHYIQTKNIGYAKDHVLVINNTGTLGSNAAAFKNEVLKLSGVSKGTYSGYLPVSNSFRGDNTYSTEAVMTPQNGFSMQNWNVDYDYIATLGMQIVAGRDFSKDYGADSTAIIINEAAAKFLGSGNVIGKNVFASDNEGRITKYHVIGVVKNFNYESLHSNIGPLGLFLNYNPYTAAFRINTSDIPGLIAQVKNAWEKLAPGMPFSYHFLDESFNNMYRTETRTGTIAILFSSLSIFIACLGLFGLATFIAEQKTREIGIRKVLGASTSGIVRLLSKDFLKLVLIAFIIAAPPGGYFMNRWLQDFAYRTELTWWIFAAAGLGALMIALVTVSAQAVKAALRNPARSLRTE